MKNLQSVFFVLVMVFLLITLAVVGTSCDDEKVMEQPIIDSFSPSSGAAPHLGAAGATVIISGKNFDATPEKNEVFFNGTQAVVTASTAVEITTSVPTGAVSGPIQVTVSGRSGFSLQEFVVIPPPTLSSFAPASGPAGTTVTINGDNFSPTTTANAVDFNGTPAVVTNASKTQLTVTVPAAATTGKIGISVSGLAVISETDFTVVVPPPAISSFSPPGAIPGASVTIIGTNFNATAANNAVTFNGLTASVTAATSTQLTVTVPSGTLTGKIAVTVSGVTGTSADDFEILKDIPRNGLLLFYPFTGNYNDHSGNNQHLVQNATSEKPQAATDRFGKNSQAYTFDGGDRLYNATLSLGIAHPITVGFWTKYNSLSLGAFVSTKQMVGFSVTATGSAGRSLLAYVENNAYQGNSNFFPATTNGTWIFIAISFDGNNFKVYKDGVFQQTLTGAGTITTSGHFYVGYSLSGGYYTGGIDDVAVYNRVLSDNEVTQLYEQTASKY